VLSAFPPDGHIGRVWRGNCRVIPPRGQGDVRLPRDGKGWTAGGRCRRMCPRDGNGWAAGARAVRCARGTGTDGQRAREAGSHPRRRRHRARPAECERGQRLATDAARARGSD
jgi:hypothetical protein